MYIIILIMSFTIEDNGRLGNQIIRNIATSFIAKKHDLLVNYCNYDKIKQLGIDPYSGKNNYEWTHILNEENYFNILNMEEFKLNVYPNKHWFQTKEITNLIHTYLYENKELTINANNYKNRYNNNNDLFLHVRTTDATDWNCGAEYYLEAIEKVTYDNIYLATDDFNCDIVKSIMTQYKNIITINRDEINTIMFGSTCKNIILSHGSFSAVIGYLGFYSTIY